MWGAAKRTVAQIDKPKPKERLFCGEYSEKPAGFSSF